MANTTNPRRNAEGYSDPTAYEALKNIEKVGLFWSINGTDGFGDERNKSVHT